jgi:hypothetical protein
VGSRLRRPVQTLPLPAPPATKASGRGAGADDALSTTSTTVQGYSTGSSRISPMATLSNGPGSCAVASTTAQNRKGNNGPGLFELKYWLHWIRAWYRLVGRCSRSQVRLCDWDATEGPRGHDEFAPPPATSFVSDGFRPPNTSSFRRYGLFLVPRRRPPEVQSRPAGGASPTPPAKPLDRCCP